MIWVAARLQSVNIEGDIMVKVEAKNNADLCQDERLTDDTASPTRPTRTSSLNTALKQTASR
eukprot:scaffold3851_cov162-Amphora_coffeaeformis.AAC.13